MRKRDAHLKAMTAHVEKLRGQYAELEKQYVEAAPTTTVRVLTDAELGRSSE